MKLKELLELMVPIDVVAILAKEKRIETTVSDVEQLVSEEILNTEIILVLHYPECIYIALVN